MEAVLRGIRHKDPIEMLEGFVNEVLPAVLPEWVVGNIETYIQGKLLYPYTHMMMWETQAPLRTVAGPLLDAVELEIARTGMLVYGMNCRGMAQVRLADHPQFTYAVRVELAVIIQPLGHPPKHPLRIQAVVSLRQPLK